MPLRQPTVEPLRQLMLRRAGVLALCTALLVALCFVWFGIRPMGQQMAREQFDAAADRVDAGLSAFFEPTVRLLAMSRGWIGGQAPHTTSPLAFNAIFKPVLEEYEALTSVVAGTSDGQGWMLLQQEHAAWRNRMTDIPRWGTQQHLLIDQTADGQTRHVWGQQTYDPRQRPWYQGALALPSERQVHWTAPYPFFTTGEPGITASGRMKLDDGRDFVLGFDLTLHDLSRLTLGASVGIDGVALVITDDGRVLALPAQPSGSSTSDWQQHLLKPAAALGLPHVTQGLLRWQRANRPHGEVLGFESDGVDWLVSVRPYLLGEQRLWNVVLAPAADFAPAWQPIALALALALLLVLAMVLWLVRTGTLALSRPLEALAQASRRIGQLDFQGDVPTRSPIAEIAALADSQQAMLTTLRNNQRELEQLAHYDALTGLPNRVLLAERLRQGMTQVACYDQKLAVAYLDLDGFKQVNDSHGHALGDQLLLLLAGRMKQALRDGDTLARLGGDEFVAVMLDVAGPLDATSLLTRLLAAADTPVLLQGRELQVSASVGVTFYPQGQVVDAEQLLRQADQAMYLAKQAGKNRYQFFDAEHDLNQRDQFEGLQRLREALQQHEFVLYYQPKVNMRSGRVVGAEALIRWQHPQQGLLAPAAFLPLIENHDLAVDVGQWVLEAALSQMSVWLGAGTPMPVSINVGARQLQHSGFAEHLRTRLAAHPQINPADLQIEVLETSALQDMARVTEVLAQCRTMGVQFALDDFGTGYSSLTYLKHLPVSQLKIDQSFVRDMLDDPDDLSILVGVLDMSAAFHRQVIAEGVETVAHGRMLLRLGCDLAQGYGIARPMPAAALPAWAATWQGDPLWHNVAVVSRQQMPLLFASAEQRAWVLTLEAYLKDEREAPVALDRHHCNVGQWIDGGGLHSQSNPAVAEKIMALHQQIHDLATHLCGLKAGHDPAAALQQLPHIRRLRDALLVQFEQLLPTVSQTGGE